MIALVTCIIETMPDSGALVQVDCATAFQTLKAESDNDGSILKKLKIKVDLGRSHNKNKNPVAENAIKEFHKESLRICPRGGPLSEIERAMVTKSMNSRIRNRGFSPKEIAFQRDQVTNQVKPISDTEMADKQYIQRKLMHPVDVSEPNQFKVGENVFLKNDKSKLRSREMYKIVDVFNENNECWATLQKSDSQFRAKDYKVKTSEIFSVPGPKLKDQGDVEHEEEDQDVAEHEGEDQDNTKIIEPDQSQDLLEPVDENLEQIQLRDIAKPDEETQQDLKIKEPNLVQDDQNADKAKDIPEIKSKRAGRKSAQLARGKFKNWVSDGLLKISINKPKHPLPNHGWDWETFKKLIEEEEDIVVQRRKTGDTIEVEEDRLSWDNSPEQYELMPDSEDEDFDIIMEPKKLFDSAEDEESLTSTTSDDEVFPNYQNTPKQNPRLKRSLEIRRPKTNTNTLTARSSPIGLATPETSSEVNLAQKQHLDKVLPRRKPIVPEAVLLGPEVQQFQAALDSLQLPPEDVDHLHEEVPNEVPEEDHAPDHQRQLRRSNRLDYKRFHAFGERSSKSNE